MRNRIRSGKAGAVWVSILCALAGSALAQQPQGVSRSEIIVGAIEDLSGPLSAFGKAARNGMQMRADEINDQGGVNGRKVRLVVEDSEFDSHQAEAAAHKLVSDDRVFAILGDIGTAENLAAMPIQFERNVINFLPLTGAREMFDPPARLKMAFMPSYFDQVRTAIPFLAARKRYQKICVIYQEDEFGMEVLRGAESALKTLNLPLAEKASFKRATTDFSSQIGKLKSAGCELVVLGTIIRETVDALSEARRSGFAPDFVGTSALYTQTIPILGGKTVDGLYGVGTITSPYSDDASKLVRDWTIAYRTKYKEDASVFSVYGYYIMDIFTKAASKAGPNLTVDRFNSAMEATTFPRDMFGSPEFHITATDRLGSRRVRIEQIVSGRWAPVSSLLDPPAPS